MSIKGYIDSHNAGDLDKRRSTLGYLFTLARGTVSWQSCLQNCIIQSTIEVEYVAATKAYKEAL